MSMSVGVAFRLHLNSESGGWRTGQYKIAVVTASGLVNEGFAVDDAKRDTLLFRFRPWKGWTSFQADASSTYGLLGGVEDKDQARVSEAVERNAADIVTQHICSCFDTSGEKELRVWILGPPFAKLVGRLASLRLPRESEILWITPNPLPKWFSLYPSVYRMRPGAGFDVGAMGGLDEADQALLRTVPFNDGSRCRIHRLSMYGAGPVSLANGVLRPAVWAGPENQLPDPLRLSALVLSQGDYDRPLWEFAKSNEAGVEFIRERYFREADARVTRRAARGRKELLTREQLDYLSEKFAEKDG